VNIRGHLGTVLGLARRRLRPPVAPPSVAWSGVVDDPDCGAIALTGRLSNADSGRLIVGVHGLGGCADSLYLWSLAAAAAERDWAVLRLNLRGADRLGEDFYHGGLTADLHGALASPALAGFGEIVLVGYSLGGHAVLRYATEAGDPRVRAAVAVCSPLDLAAGQLAIDRPGAWIYRRYVLAHVKEIYRQVAVRRSVPIPVADADRIRRLWDWDDAVVAARHGYRGADDYYARASVAGRLDRLRLPSLLVATEDDPMVPAAIVRRCLKAPTELETVWVARGGHVAFSAALDLGLGGRRGLASQLLSWVESHLG